MKKVLSALLSTTFLLSALSITASAAETVTLPQATEQTITINYSADTWDTSWSSYDYQDVTLKITYDGYLGFMSTEPYSGPNYEDIVVVEKGSTFTVEVVSDDPMASYNFFTDLDLSQYPGYSAINNAINWTAGQDPYQGIPIYSGAYQEDPYAMYVFNELGRTRITQPTENTFLFEIADGLRCVDLINTHTPSDEQIAEMLEPLEQEEIDAMVSVFDYPGFPMGIGGNGTVVGAWDVYALYSYGLPATLAIDQGDIDELVANGTMMPIDETGTAYYDYIMGDIEGEELFTYPGLLEAFGGEAPPIPPCTKTLDYAWYLPNGNPGKYDTGAALKLTLENPADVEQQVLSALVRKGDWAGALWEVDYFNYILAPNQTVSQDFGSQINLTCPEHFYWVNFDSVEELNQYKAATPFGGYDEAYQLDEATGDAWIADNFGLTQ